jgi:hypothetical protein
MGKARIDEALWGSLALLARGTRGAYLGVRTGQLPIPPPDFYDFVMVYVPAIQLALLVLPRKVSNRILETLFPTLRRVLY